MVTFSLLTAINASAQNSSEDMSTDPNRSSSYIEGPRKDYTKNKLEEMIEMFGKIESEIPNEELYPFERNSDCSELSSYSMKGVDKACNPVLSEAEESEIKADSGISI